MDSPDNLHMRALDHHPSNVYEEDLYDPYSPGGGDDDGVAFGMGDDQQVGYDGGYDGYYQGDDQYGEAGDPDMRPDDHGPPSSAGFGGSDGINDFGNEPPLLEELGIDFAHIRYKTFTVLNPFRRGLDTNLIDDADLSGPMVFCLLFGFALLLVREFLSCLCCPNIHLHENPIFFRVYVHM